MTLGAKAEIRFASFIVTERHKTTPVRCLLSRSAQRVLRMRGGIREEKGEASLIYSLYARVYVCVCVRAFVFVRLLVGKLNDQ